MNRGGRALIVVEGHTLHLVCRGVNDIDPPLLKIV